MIIEHDISVNVLTGPNIDMSVSKLTREETRIFLDKLDQLYHFKKVDTTTRDRFAVLKWEQLIEPNGINRNIKIKILDILNKMAVEESDDTPEQKSIINRAWSVLSHTDKTKARLNAKVSACKTFKEFFLMLCRDRIDQDKQVDRLVADGYTIAPRVYILTSKHHQSSDRNTPLLKDKSSKIKKVSSDSNKGVPGNKNTYSDITPCNHCGRKSVIRKTGKPHTTATCNLSKHPDRNPDASVLWKDSSQGKAYAALSPSLSFLPYDLLKDGSVRPDHS
jgi:hypothetical protein